MQITIALRSFTFMLVVCLLAGKAAQSQQAMPRQGTPSTLELTYNYVRTNGPPGYCGCINLNGGGIAYVRPLSGSDFSLIGSLRATHAGAIGALGYDLTLFTYTAGARYLPRMKHAYLQPYGELELGGVHASGSLASAPSLAGKGISNSFAATAGGGINLNLHQRISFKLIEAEYLTTNYANGDTDHQNDLRLSGGLVISLCSSKKCTPER
jgi:hypothetical protein